METFVFFITRCQRFIYLRLFWWKNTFFYKFESKQLVFLIKLNIVVCKILQPCAQILVKFTAQKFDIKLTQKSS